MKVINDVYEGEDSFKKKINEVLNLQLELMRNGATSTEAIEIIKTAALCEIASCVTPGGRDNGVFVVLSGK